MKLTKTFYSVAAVALMTASLVSCGSKKDVTNNMKNSEVIEIPCSGPDFWSNEDHFRANALGESADLMTAKKRAMSNARAQLAADIESTMKVVGDNYVKSVEVNNQEELTETFQENARTVVSQTLRGLRTICEKQMMNSTTGQYTYYVAIELGSQEFLEKMNERLSSDDRVRAEYDYQKFKETFDAEMAKIEAQQN